MLAWASLNYEQKIHPLILLEVVFAMNGTYRRVGLAHA